MALYKYVSPERIDIIENQRIRFTQPTDFNDPFDTNPHIISLTDDKWVESFIKDTIGDEQELNRASKEALEKELSKYGLTRDSRLFDFGALLSQHKQLMREIAPQWVRDTFQLRYPFLRQVISEAINNTIGILSLTEKPDNILMWGHYADSHRGFVIEFDKGHNFFDQRENPQELQGHIKKVNYLKERPQIQLYDSTLNDEENLENWVEKFIWCKSNYWEYEAEWRMIYTFKGKEKILTRLGDRICLFPLPLDCVKAVILGCKMSPENRGRIMLLLKQHKESQHIETYEAKEDAKESKLNIFKIK